jgi:HAD superfamily hydrolase (TIGR01509 family)
MQLAQLVIFDCDGVLVDSETVSNEVLAKALTGEGLPTTLDDAVRDYKGLMLSEVVALAEQRLGRSLRNDFLDRYRVARAQAFHGGLERIAGAAEAVRAVIAAGLGVCVASQGELEKTRLTLALTGLRELFPARALFSACSVARGKPRPDLFLHAASAMGAKPASRVVVEDSLLGVGAAVAAGMRAIAYIAENDGAAMREAGAQVVRSIYELPSVLRLA